MRKLIFTILVLIASQNIFAQSGWNAQSSNTHATLLSIFFINQNTGWVCGDSGVTLKTTNGGINWSMQNYGGTTHRKIFLQIQITGGL